MVALLLRYDPSGVLFNTLDAQQGLSSLAVATQMSPSPVRAPVNFQLIAPEQSFLAHGCFFNPCVDLYSAKDKGDIFADLWKYF